MTTEAHVPAGQILTPISVGELADKITILQIKSERITDPAKLANIRVELDRLLPLWDNVRQGRDDLEVMRAQLKEVNERMWDVQDALRDRESARHFDATFIQLARDVGRHNGVRVGFKNQINEATGSTLREVKQYQAEG